MCQFLIKLNIYLLDSVVLLLSIFPREMNLCSIKNLYINVHSSFICESQNWKWLKSHSVSERINKWWYIHTMDTQKGIKSNKQEQTHVTHKDFHGSQEHFAE